MGPESSERDWALLHGLQPTLATFRQQANLRSDGGAPSEHPQGMAGAV